jgi:TRAP-type C4-dicarboxylate transport system substrate-binding protein
LVEPDLSLIEEIESEGVEITRLTEDERQAFVDATRGVYDEWSETIGQDLVTAAEEAIANR